MKYLNSKYELFESEINEIIKKCKKYHIEKYEIDDDGLLTVFGYVNLFNKSLKEIPLKFKEVYGNFDISNNNITSLFGSPLIVNGNVNISNTKIKDLKYAPIEICGNFLCVLNKNLINITHFPKRVDGYISFWECGNLKSLYGCLNFLNDGIDLGGCHSLNSMKYGPHKVLGIYACNECKLKSLYGAPKYVGDRFNCSYNELTSLKYSPRFIGGDFDFKNNNIRSFNYFPEWIGGEINCYNNPVHNVWKLFEDKEYIEYFNQMKIISDDGKKINIKKLNVFLNSIGKESVEYVEGYENI